MLVMLLLGISEFLKTRSQLMTRQHAYKHVSPYLPRFHRRFEILSNSDGRLVEDSSPFWQVLLSRYVSSASLHHQFIADDQLVFGGKTS